MNFNTKDSPMNFTKTLAAEARELRMQLDRDQSEASCIALEVPDLEAEAETYAIARTAAEIQPTERASEVIARLGWIGNRLRQINDTRDDGERRLRTLTDRLEAGPRAEQARADVSKAQEWITAATRRRDANAGSVEKLLVMQREHQTQEAAQLQSRTAAILAAVGVEGNSQQSEQPPADVAVHAQAGLAISAALRDAQAKQELLDQDLAAAHDAAQAARAALAAQLVNAAELRHAEALSEYLPRLAEYLAAHDAAHEWRPKAPDVGRMAEPGIAAAADAFRASLTAEVSQGVVAKAAKAVRGLLS